MKKIIVIATIMFSGSLWSAAPDDEKHNNVQVPAHDGSPCRARLEGMMTPVQLHEITNMLRQLAQPEASNAGAQPKLSVDTAFMDCADAHNHSSTYQAFRVGNAACYDNRHLIAVGKVYGRAWHALDAAHSKAGQPVGPLHSNPYKDAHDAANAAAVLEGQSIDKATQRAVRDSLVVPDHPNEISSMSHQVGKDVVIVTRVPGGAAIDLSVYFQAAAVHHALLDELRDVSIARIEKTPATQRLPEAVEDNSPIAPDRAAPAENSPNCWSFLKRLKRK